MGLVNLVGRLSGGESSAASEKNRDGYGLGTDNAMPVPELVGVPFAEASVPAEHLTAKKISVSQSSHPFSLPLT